MKQWATSINHHLRVWIVFVRLKMIQFLVYRADFIFSSLGSVSWVVATLLTYKVIFGQVDQIAGWSWEEMIILYGIYNLFWGIFITFLSGGHSIGSKIRYGGFDAALLRPLNNIFSATLRFSPDFIVHIFSGSIIFIYGLNVANISVPLLNYLLFSVLFINGLAMGYFLGLIFGCSAFWMIENDQMVSLFWNIEAFAKYPSEFFKFSKVIYLLIFTLVPIMFIVVVPVKILTSGFDPLLFFGAFGSSALLILISTRLWKVGIKRYNGVSI